MRREKGAAKKDPRPVAMEKKQKQKRELRIEKLEARIACYTHDDLR